MLQVRQSYNLHLLSAITPEIHIDPFFKEILEPEGSVEGGNSIVRTVCVYDLPAYIVRTIRWDGYLQDLTVLSFAENGEGAFGLYFVVAA
jgi:hypothetical protein